jgi:hypothetical protein
MIADREMRRPGSIDNLARRLQTVMPSHLLDSELCRFQSPPRANSYGFDGIILLDDAFVI